MRTITVLCMLYLLNCRANTTPDSAKLPFFNVDHAESSSVSTNNVTVRRSARDFDADVYPNDFIPLATLIDKEDDTSEFWRETEILNLIRSIEEHVDYDKCDDYIDETSLVHFPPIRTVRAICKNYIDRQLCPQCPTYSNITECELFRDSCTERRVHPFEYRTYCDNKYGKWRTMFMAANYSECRCCDECIFYRELDQSCVQDQYVFEIEEFLPVTTIDFRAGCNPYLGHPRQEEKALKCEKSLRRCVPVTGPEMTNEAMYFRRSHRFEPPTDESQCPTSCEEYECADDTMRENECAPGAFLPDKTMCNCCGQCSSYQQLDQKCAEYRRTSEIVDGIRKIKIEEDLFEPGCDDGLVCREGRCQDIHTLESGISGRRSTDEVPYEPCKHEMKNFKKKYGRDGHLHDEAPQCTPLWLYAPIQCRKLVCYCSLEDGTFIEGVEIPRANVSNMNCDCAREKYRTDSDIECDKYGNYKHISFIQHVNEGNVLIDKVQHITRKRIVIKGIKRTTKKPHSRYYKAKQKMLKKKRGGPYCSSKMNKSYLPIVLLSLCVTR